MAFARAIARDDTQKNRFGTYTNFSEFMREEGGDPGYGKVVRKEAFRRIRGGGRY